MSRKNTRNSIPVTAGEVTATPLPAAMVPVRIVTSVEIATDNLRFEAGQVYHLLPPSAERWVRRNIATYIDHPTSD